MVDLERTVERDSNLRKPYGCLYWGYQNPYVLYIINWYFAKDDLLCIVRFLDFGVRMQGNLYMPIFKDEPAQAPNYYCYLYF